MAEPIHAGETFSLEPRSSFEAEVVRAAKRSLQPLVGGDACVQQ